MSPRFELELKGEEQMKRVGCLLVLLFFVLSHSVGYAGAGIVPSPSGQNSENTSEAAVVRPAGRWTTTCDPLRVIHVTWTSEISLSGGVFIIEADFSNFGPRYNKRQLPEINVNPGKKIAFHIMESKESTWLYMMADGSLDPERSGFDQSDTALGYPGGYRELAEEISHFGIDWENLYLELKATAEEIRSDVDAGTFCPAPFRKKSPGKILTI